MLDVMLDLAKQGKTMLIVTHEMQFAKAVADRMVFLEGGKISWKQNKKRLILIGKNEISIVKKQDD